MATIRELIRQENTDRCMDENAEAKDCQDSVLKALSDSSFSGNDTIKGWVVMRSNSHDARRVTLDMDINFNVIF